MKKLTLIRCIIPLLLLTACIGERRNQSSQNDDETYFAYPDDPILRSAMIKAQEEIDYFIKVMMENPSDTNYWFVVKSAFEYNDRKEHMWSNTFRFEGENFICRLASEPLWISNLSMGDTVIIHRDQVEDWILYDNYTKSKVGEFTANY